MQRKSSTKLKAVATPELSPINQDRERVSYLAACIYPGDGFVSSDDTPVGQMLIEIVSIIAKYDEQDDRDYLTYTIAETIYTETFEGHGVIDAYLKRASVGKYAGAQKSGVR